MAKFYVTTPIYYINDVPHIGHAYTTIAADVLARYYRRQGRDVFFLTGTDEHGAKIAEAAAQAGKSPQAFADEMVVAFKEAWQLLNISYDYFIRTTDPRHEAAVRKFLQVLYDKGDIYKGLYEGLYCVGCERFYSEDELVDGLCPLHLRPPVHYAEENYFFRLSKYQEVLLRALTTPTDPWHYRVEPLARYNEVLGKLRLGLSDISISRATLTWGIPLPFDPTQTTYVWVDALINYISAIGYGDDPATFQRYWPADLHLMAKDILWFHAVIWPALLIAAGLPTPRRIYAHGFFTVEGQKMSKSLGNVIRPAQLVERFGADATRYLMLSEFPFGADGDISLESFAKRYNADLANDLGNLLNRALSMVHRYCDGQVPAPGPEEEPDRALREAATGLFPTLERAFEALEFHVALEAVRQVVAQANRYVDATQPWVLARSDRVRLGTVLYTLLETLRLVAEALWPVMPSAAERMAAQLGVTLAPGGTWLASPPRWGARRPGERVTTQPTPLFPRLEERARR